MTVAVLFTVTDLQHFGKKQLHLVISQKYLEIFLSISISMLQANKNVVFNVWS